MFSSASATYSLKRPARCIASLVSKNAGQENNEDTPRFVAGTCSLREPNELHILGYREESNELLCDQVLSHPDEIWGVSPSPTDPSLLMTCSNGAEAGEILERGGDYKVSLWKLPETDPGHDPLQDPSLGGTRTPPVEKLDEPRAEIGGLKAAATAMMWSPVPWSGTEEETVATLADGKLQCWKLGTGRFEEAGSATVCEEAAGVVAAREAPAAAWDPHHSTNVATVVRRSVKFWDIRTMASTNTLKDAHRYAARDVDYNPNKPFCVVTCGEDRLVKFWDLRSLGRPIKSIIAHEHWVNTVKYNRFHDQLLLSGSSDCMVHLWRVSSVSSAPLLEPEEEDGAGLETEGVSGGFGLSNGTKGEGADIRVRTFDEHEESVYSVSWSACDAWVLVSLSYDGQVLLNHVPSTEKYKILL